MSRPYEYPPPPGSNNVVSSEASSTQRRRPPPLPPPTISTSIVVPPPPGTPSQTPISAATLGTAAPFPYSPRTPSGLNPHYSSAPPLSGSAVPSPRTPHFPTPQTPSMEPYNPRQWTNRGQISGSQMVFQPRAGAAPPSTRETTGMESTMPSPPPPYSHETGEITGAVRPLLETVGLTSSPATVHSATSSPQVPMSPSFPPPPGKSAKRERSSSSLRQGGLFSLAGLRGKQSASPELLFRNSVHVPDLVEPKPPAARRAASTGQLQSSGSATALAESVSSERTTPDNGWQPGMPLPGPPPGPPPPGTRSQSLNRVYPATSSHSTNLDSERVSGPTQAQHRASFVAPRLDPVPPTPAGWVDTDATQTPPPPVPPKPQDHSKQKSPVELDSAEVPSSAFQALRINTGSSKGSGSSGEGSLTRRPAQRNSDGYGILERRSKSRAAKSGSNVTSPAADGTRAGDVVTSPDSASPSQRREHMRAVSGYVNTQTSAQPPGRAASQPPVSSSILTPPYSPGVSRQKDDRNKTPSRAAGALSDERPISHILHQPIDNVTIPAPLAPGQPKPDIAVKSSARLDTFSAQAVDRHRIFIEKESTATSDEERLELFANFVVHESRLRRDRYSAAYTAMASDIVDLTRDMWRSYTRQSKRATASNITMPSPDSANPSWAVDGQSASAQGNEPSSDSSFGGFTPGTDAASMGDPTEERPEPKQSWGEAFKPSLSPIPSMAVSTAPDDDSSRGRTASRWWEQSNSGSGSIGKPDRFEKSHRETKYMGINAAALQESEHPSPQSSRYTGSTPSATVPKFPQGANEYPPEKVGWQDSADNETPMATPKHQQERERKVSTPGANPLNVSRLITLPPPYPRHHPAVTNSHPLLAHVRSEHRRLADYRQIEKLKSAYIDADYALQKEQQAAAKARRMKIRASVHGKVADGTISFAEAAQAEADFDAEEAERGKADARALFDAFEVQISHPLNSLLTERLGQVNECITKIRAELESRNQVSDPNQVQEEGDAQPERLEKLTLLKWLFESREQLYKELFDLHAERSAKYSEVILHPYRIAKLQSKINEATSFFARDNQERQATFANESSKRFEDLQSIMESNVSRGVEDQLSAFWDIAPGLLEVIQHVPSNVSVLEIDISPQEYAENPTYADHPLQYLYTLLVHAQKSTYQFIESQTNLLCLLHEVRTATTKASLRLLEIERTAASPEDSALRDEMQAARQVQEERLTEDLQEKVGEVERQWKEALGQALEECRERVRGFLEERGGWEDGLEN